MKKYLAFFRLRFTMGLQYRAAALGGLVCQFFWGAMYILSMKAFYDTDPAAFPMTFPAAASYIWLQQALLTLVSMGGIDNEFFNVIQNGNVAYELCRPVDVYGMWFTRSAATRVANALLRLIAVGICDFFSGNIVPLPFFPEGFRQFSELLPFSSTANVPIRIYTGDLAGREMVVLMLMQVFWIVALVGVGKLLEWKELKTVVVQGG